MERTPLVRVAAGASFKVGGTVWPPLLTLGLTSPVAEHLIAQHSAIKMLHSRVKLILEYVKASEAGRTGVSWFLKCFPLPPGAVTASTLMQLLVPSGEVPFNHEILREAYALCHCLPVLSTDKFKTDFYDVSAKPRMGRWGSRYLLHAGHDRLLCLGIWWETRAAGELLFSVPSQLCNDVGLMAYLGTITKTCNTMNQFVNKFNVLYDRQGIGRRMRGLFF